MQRGNPHEHTDQDSLRDHRHRMEDPVKPGDTLQADDTLMVLESMKMEIPVVAPEAGRVVEILIGEGAPVREGQEVAVFEEE